jgi:hypothetical protein
MDRFILQWFWMRVMSVVALVVGGWLMWKMWQKKTGVKTSPLWIFFNPLILLEFVSNNHNDWWMVTPALASFYLVAFDKKTTGRIIASALLLLASTQIKYATLVLVPFWLYVVIDKKYLQWLLSVGWLKALYDWAGKHLFDLMAIAMFVPLLTPRAQLFHPWYLSWSLGWWPLCRLRVVKYALLFFSLSALLRYSAYLWIGEYNLQTTIAAITITFAGAAVLGIGVWLVKFVSKKAFLLKRS